MSPRPIYHSKKTAKITQKRLDNTPILAYNIDKIKGETSRGMTEDKEMAKATITYTCKVCGRQTTESTTKYSRREADSWEVWAAAHIDTCPECRSAAKKAAHESKMAEEFAAFLAESEIKPVQLTGTSKQIAWAETIRRDCIVNAQRIFGDLIPTATIAAINTKPESKWWIDHRYVPGDELICKIAEEAENA